MEESRHQIVTELVKNRIQNRVLWREADAKERLTIEQAVFCIVDIVLAETDKELINCQRELASLTYERDHLKDVLDGANKLFRYLGNLGD